MTLKKPGEKIELDVPFRRFQEMKVDVSKELEAEKLHEVYLEYNKGKVDILKADPNGEKFSRGFWLAGGVRTNSAEGNLPIWDTEARLDVERPTTSLRKWPRRLWSGLTKQAGQIGGLCRAKVT
ncbi:MAG: hypothetical protein R2941_02170 [Desulfobacterales bacterium]